jgi:hypothetical protein
VTAKMADNELQEDLPEDLSIPTEVCPHCGKPRSKVCRRWGGISRDFRPREWMVYWECGSYVILSSRPFLHLASKCTKLDI